MADSGLNYRRYKEGKISPQQFWTQTSLLSLTTIEGLAGGAGGLALGFTIGSILMPGLGTLIGSLVGALAGEYVGDRVMLQQYQSLESRIDRAKAIHEKHSGDLNFVTEEGFKAALKLLDSKESDELITIENRFFEKQHLISEKLHEAIKDRRSDIIIKGYRAELDSLY